MALDRLQLQQDIENLTTEMRGYDAETYDQQYAFRLSTIIHNYVKTGSINYDGGLVAPNGSVTGVINGNIE